MRPGNNGPQMRVPRTGRTWLGMAMALAGVGASIGAIAVAVEVNRDWTAFLALGGGVGLVISSHLFHTIRLGGPLTQDPDWSPPLWLMRCFLAAFTGVFAFTTFLMGEPSLRRGHDFHFASRVTPLEDRHSLRLVKAWQGIEARRVGAGVCLGSTVPALWTLVLLWPGFLRSSRVRVRAVRGSLAVLLVALGLLMPPWRALTSPAVAAFYGWPILYFAAWAAICRKRESWTLIPAFLLVVALGCAAGTFFFQAGRYAAFEAVMLGFFTWTGAAAHLFFLREDIHRGPWSPPAHRTQSL